MSEQPAEGPESRAPEEQDVSDDPLEGEGEGKGIEVTMGEPSSFEPEEDPAASGSTETD